MSRVLLCAMPFTGHVNPVLAVAAELVARGHDARVYTGSAFRAKVEAVGARHVPWHRAPDLDEHDLAATFPRLRGRAGLGQVLRNLEDLFIATGPAQVEDLVAEHRREPWDLLVAEESSVGPALAAERLGTPWATTAIVPLSLPSGQGAPSGMALAPGAGPLGRARDAVLRSLTPALMRPLRRPVARAREEAGLPPSDAAFDRATFSPRLVLASGVPALDHGRTDRPGSLTWIGRFDDTTGRAAEPPGWLAADDRPVVLVTQGTQSTDPGLLLQPALTTLADRDDLLVVATSGQRGRHALPFPTAPHVRVVDQVPYDAVLPRAQVMVTNGGWGGVLASLWHGVPLVVAGGELDKPEVACRVASSGAGVDLRSGHPTARAVAQGLARAASPGVRERARKVAADLRRAGGTRRAVDLLEAELA